jgi:hemoglobin
MAIKREITHRAEVYLLVDEFYKKIRKDALLGPIFNTTIKDWPKHLNHLTDFWETQLFFVSKFKGNPSLKHQLVDAQNKHSINSLHFGIWLNYWFETLDTLFQGERAELAKARARNLGTHLYLEIFKSRPKEIKT